ncbi:hypothetical protein [Tardiphaga sp. P9-11]|uniref:hypothetical protein n=1 Tax=Tardiphaga sp. P9-11 TaxID=2024614 RepID=UPI0011F11FA0|nr:hypothetical protein [Tardiphaga sp. P9-11]KAA0069968.1 hypothetical protein CIW50_27755 [Tardiphaga sp. P9-11]
MKVTIIPADGERMSVVFNLETRIPTRMGAAFTLQDRTTARYLTDTGWSDNKALLKPTITVGQVTELTVLVAHTDLPSVDTEVELRIPAANFADQLNWPSSEPLPTSLEATEDKSAARSKQSLQKVLETLGIEDAGDGSTSQPTAEIDTAPSDVVPLSQCAPVVQRWSMDRKPQIAVTLAALVFLLGIAAVIYASVSIREMASREQQLASAQEQLGHERDSVAKARSALSLAQERLIKEQGQVTEVQRAQAAESERLKRENGQLDSAKTSLAAGQANLKNGLERLAADQKALDNSKATQSLPSSSSESERLKSERSALLTGQAELQNGIERLAAERKAFEDSKSAQLASPLGNPAAPVATIPKDTLAAIAPSAVTKSQADLVAACDQLAANPTNRDKGSSSEGVTWGQLDTAAAIAACEKAADAVPANRRVAYQLGRALHRGGFEDRARVVFGKLVEQQYPSAFDNAGALEKDFQRSVWLFRKGSQLGDPDSMDSLASLLLKGQATESYAGETYALLTKASELGSAAARKRLDQLNSQAAQNARNAQGANVAYWTLMSLQRAIRDR